MQWKACVCLMDTDSQNMIKYDLYDSSDSSKFSVLQINCNIIGDSSNESTNDSTCALEI